MGPASMWRPGEQRECMEKILALPGEESAICVLPTGAGKSLLFMVPAVMRGGHERGGGTIRGVDDGDGGEGQTDGSGCGGVPAVGQLGAGKFAKGGANGGCRRGHGVGAKLARVSGQTGRVRAAPAHIHRRSAHGDHGCVLPSETDAAQGLTRYQKPTVLLTATLPVTFERWFREELLAGSAETIRERTTKANCRYEVEQVKAGRGGVSVRCCKDERLS